MHSLVESMQLFVPGVWGKVLICASKQEGGNGRDAARRLGWGSVSIGGTDRWSRTLGSPDNDM